MGLDIHLYTNIEICKNEEDANFVAYNLKGFEFNHSTLQNGASYKGQNRQYVFSGSYSGWGAFRKFLCSILSDNIEIEQIWNNPLMFRGCPFFRIVNFADNEGVIDSASCKILAADFEEFYKYAKSKDVRGFYFDIYTSLLQALKTASEQNGCLVFS